MKVKKYLLLFILGFLLIILSGGVYYFAVQLPARRTAELELEKAKLVNQEREIKQDKETKLEECLEKAKEKANDLWELNSYSDPQEGHPDARRWNSIEIQTKTEENYNRDRQFCLERFK